MALAALSQLRSAVGRQPLWRHSCLSAPWAPLSLARCRSGRRGGGSDGGRRAEARAPSLKGNYGQLCERAAREPGPFWGALARETLQWETPHHTDCQGDFAQGRIRWFLGGRLNVAVNCLDRHVQHIPDKVALIWEKDEPGTEEKITYS